MIDFVVNKNYKIVYNAEHMVEVIKLFSDACYVPRKINKLKNKLFNRNNDNANNLFIKCT